MKKRVLSLLLATVFLFAVLPQVGITTFAASEPPQFTGVSLALENNIAIRFYADGDALAAAG